MGHTHRYKFDFLKKKSGKESQYLFSHPETGSDPPIGSDRESGCDNGYLNSEMYSVMRYSKAILHCSWINPVFNSQMLYC